MNITKDQFQVMKDLYINLPHGDQFDELPQEMQDLIIQFGVVLVNLEKKRKAVNKRTASYIADKRQTNKNYAR